MNQKKIRKIFKLSLFLSIFLHLIFGYIKLSMEFKDSKKLSYHNKLKVKLDQRDKRPAEQKKISRQIVTTKEVKSKDRPKDSKFLSKSDQAVDRQTIAKNI